MSNWTNIEDGLPDDHQDVLAAFQFGFVVANYLEGQWWDEDGRIQYNITHWMPIVGPDEA